jgi:uncharacterized oxidoreductase
VDEPGNGVAFMVLDISAFIPQTEFLGRIRELRSYMKSSPPAEDQGEVMLPGEPESRTRQARERLGIMINDEVWEQTLRAAQTVGVEWSADFTDS